MKVIVSLAQMNIRLGVREKNIRLAQDWIREAENRRSSIILFPELWSSGYDLSNGIRHAFENVGLVEQLVEYAKQSSIVIGGTLLETDQNGNLYNVFNVILPTSPPQLVKYQKIHLFGLMEEKRWLCAGNHLQIVPLKWEIAALATCYDLRFPEMFRRYAALGAKIFFISAEWPLQRAEHWRILLRARAIENQVFVIAVNSVGTSGQHTFAGYSTVISPSGEILIEGSSTKEDLITTEIDLSTVDDARQSMPVFDDRRLDIYGYRLNG